jgi:hypothetical protein
VNPSAVVIHNVGCLIPANNGPGAPSIINACKRRHILNRDRRFDGSDRSSTRCMRCSIAVSDILMHSSLIVCQIFQLQAYSDTRLQLRPTELKSVIDLQDWILTQNLFNDSVIFIWYA